jgi:hypothetical protein
MTERTITEEQLREALGEFAETHQNVDTKGDGILTCIMAAAFPPKFKAQHNQIIAVSDIEGDFSANTFQKFMHMSEDRYECLGSSHLQGDTTYHWPFARALTEVELGGAELDGSNLVPNVNVYQFVDLESESPAVPKPVDLRLKVSLLEARLDKLEKAPSEKFATREDLASLLATLILALGNNDRGYSLLRADDIDLLKDLKKLVLK